jgi:hypothetical protein
MEVTSVFKKAQMLPLLWLLLGAYQKQVIAYTQASVAVIL